jgi:hypothetical protein
VLFGCCRAVVKLTIDIQHEILPGPFIAIFIAVRVLGSACLLEGAVILL